MAAGTLTRTAYGFDSGAEDAAWTLRAACLGDFRFADGPFGTEENGRREARELIHRCQSHCAVIVQCDRAAQANPPRGMVQAGQLWADTGRQLNRRPAPVGCGKHCAGLPAVHGGVR